MVFADKLQSLRKSKGLSQEELAEKCNVTRQSVSKWETGLGYPETEKLLILCEILDVDLDYLMRDKTATAEDCSVQREISSYESYVGKWVRIFLKDREFNGLHCVALVSIQKSYLIIMNDKGKLGFIDGYSVSTISDFVDKKKQMKLPPIPSKESIKDIIRNKGNTHLIIEEIRNLYIDFDKECELNGFKTLDISKVNSVIGYFSSYVPQLYKVKLMNLLWYVDFVFYKLYNKSMTALVYKHLQMGAVPIAHNKLLELPSIKVKEEMNYDYIRHIISPIREISINEFSLEELGVLQKVVSFFKELETKEIIEYVYCEKAYKETEIDEVMSYKYSKELVGF